MHIRTFGLLAASLVVLAGCTATTTTNTNTSQPTVVEPVVVDETATLETITVYQVNADATDYEPVTVEVDPATLTVDIYGYRNYVNAAGDIFVETPNELGVFRPEGTDFWDGAPDEVVPEVSTGDGDFQDGLTEEGYERMNAPIQEQIDAANEAANNN